MAGREWLRLPSRKYQPKRPPRRRRHDAPVQSTSASPERTIATAPVHAHAWRRIPLESPRKETRRPIVRLHARTSTQSPPGAALVRAILCHVEGERKARLIRLRIHARQIARRSCEPHGSSIFLFTSGFRLKLSCSAMAVSCSTMDVSCSIVAMSCSCVVVSCWSIVTLDAGRD
jgi:hypothetical protein